MIKKHHISHVFANKKVLISVLGVMFLLLGLIFVYSINVWNEGYNVPTNLTMKVKGGNNGTICRNITNNCTVGNGIFVPTKYDAEWQGGLGFLTKAPSCIKIEPCTCSSNADCGTTETCGPSPIITSPITYNISNACVVSSIASDGSYGTYGTRIFNTGFPVNAVNSTYGNTTLSTNYWKNTTSSTSSTVGPVNRISVWLDSDCNGSKDALSSSKELTLSHVINNTGAKRTIYLGAAGDNYFRVKFNGVVIAETDTSSHPNFKYLNVFPVTLKQGYNYFEVLGRGDGSVNDALAFILYDNTLAQLQNASSDASLKILFSSKNLIGGSNRLTAATCPEGYYLDTSMGATNYVCRSNIGQCTLAVGCRTNADCSSPTPTCSGYVAATCNGTYTPSGTQKYCKIKNTQREGGNCNSSNRVDYTDTYYTNACSSISDCQSSQHLEGTNDYGAGGICDWTQDITSIACEAPSNPVNQCSVFKSQSTCTPSGCSWGVPGGGGYCEGTLPDGSDCEQAYNNESDCSSSEWQCSWQDGFGPEVLGKCVVSATNGVCGEAAGSSFKTTPTVGLCAQGLPSTVTSTTSTWNWTCAGLNGGTTKSCSASKITSTACVRPFSCFVAGTQVVMSDGSSKNIEEVSIGDELLGMSGSINKVIDFDRPQLGDRLLYSINGGDYFVTPEHPFMTTEGWQAIDPDATKMEMPDFGVSKLTVGDIIVTKDGFVRIYSLHSKVSNPDQTLYNFKLLGNHTYYADGYLVHNKQAGLACTRADSNCNQVGYQCYYGNGSCIPEDAFNGGSGAPCNGDGDCNDGMCIAFSCYDCDTPSSVCGYCSSNSDCPVGNYCATSGQCRPTPSWCASHPNECMDGEVPQCALL